MLLGGSDEDTNGLCRIPQIYKLGTGDGVMEKDEAIISNEAFWDQEAEKGVGSTTLAGS